VLGQIFGSKDVSCAVAQNASSHTGLDPALLKKMQPMLAMLVAGFMSKQDGGTAAPAAATQGSLGGLLGGQGAEPGGGSAGLASMLDLNGDGNSLDDILRLAGKAMRGVSARQRRRFILFRATSAGSSGPNVGFGEGG
jgi:hypothetical protein